LPLKQHIKKQFSQDQHIKFLNESVETFGLNFEYYVYFEKRKYLTTDWL